MKYIKITVLLVLFAVNAIAQHAVKIKQDAEKIVKATANSDVNTIIKYTHPKLVKAMGGTQKMAEILTKSMAEVKASGAVINGEIGEPGKIIAIGSNLYSVVPQKILVTMKGTKVVSNSSLLAISFNKGGDWYFIDAGNMDDAKLRYFAPEIIGKITLPKKTTPQVITE